MLLAAALVTLAGLKRPAQAERVEEEEDGASSWRALLMSAALAWSCRGPGSHAQTGNHLPYSPYGGDGSNLFGRSLPVDSSTLTAKASSEYRQGGPSWAR